MSRSRRTGNSASTSTAMSAALAVVALVAGLPGLSDIGVTSDEPRYFLSVERIQDWAGRVASPEWREAMSSESLRTAWDSDRYYNPHPPAYKVGMAVTDGVFGGWLDPPVSYRLSPLLMFVLLVFLLTYSTASAADLAAGLGAGLSLILMPRVFGHAHIAATDMPLTLLWFTGTLGLYRYVRGGSRRWLIVVGVSMGLGMATKFTGFLLPMAVVPWMLLERRWRRSALALCAGGALALLVAVLVNPGAWLDPVGYQMRLVEESLSRRVAVPISTHYRGGSFGFEVPWEHPIVMTAIATPVSVLALAAVGMKTGLRDARTRSLTMLCVVQIAFWLALIALPSSPNHDGVRLWLPMFPFVALTAGLGFSALVGALTTRVSRQWAAVAPVLLGLLYFTPPLTATVSSYPYYLSYYGETIGGLSGADRSGMEVSYWFDAITESFRSGLNRQLPDSARVLAHPSLQYVQLLQGLGLLRTDLEFTREPPADYLLMVARKAKFDAAFQKIYQSVEPRMSTRLQGVVLVGLYDWQSVAPYLAEDAVEP